jgi:hypothetical protein
VNIYLVVGIFGLIIGAVYQPWQNPYFWGPRIWVGLVVAAIISMLFAPHCGFLRLPMS